MSREVHVRSLWGTGGEIPPVYPAFGGAKGKGASGGPARPKVPKHRAGADCSVVAMKRVMSVERRGRVTHGCWANGKPEEPNCTGRRQPSKSGTSRMNREIHVRICESLGVGFPWATRPKRSISYLIATIKSIAKS